MTVSVSTQASRTLSLSGWGNRPVHECDVYRPERLTPSFRLRRLAAAEPRVRREGRVRQWLYTGKIWFQNVLLVLFLRFDVTTGTTRWRAYPELLAATTDHRKFDAMLRMVLAGSPDQRHALAAYLDAQRRGGTLSYGLHVSDRATMTCLVYERMGRQVHFVDGAEGGYTQAARQLKQQLRSRTAA